MQPTGERWRLGIRLVGIALLLIAGLGPFVWGVTHHQNSDGVAGYDFATDDPLSGYGDPRLQRRRGESTLAYVERATLEMGAAVYHCQPTELQTWDAAMVTWLTPEFPGPEGIVDPVSLRCGFCSQVSVVLARVFRANGVPSAHPRGLDGHVVIEFDYEGASYVTDPDFGVGPWKTSWSDPVATARTVRTVYGEHEALQDRYPYLEDLVRITADTSTDTPSYDVAAMESLADVQADAIRRVRWFRWALLGGSLTLVAATFLRPRRSRAATDRPAAR